MPSIRPTPISISHHTQWQVYTVAIIHHGRGYTMTIWHLDGDTPWQSYTTAEGAILVHHGRERCKAVLQSMIRFITGHTRLETILLCIGVNTSHVFLICLFSSCFYVLLSDRYTVRNMISTDGANLGWNKYLWNISSDTHLSEPCWYQLLKTV